MIFLLEIFYLVCGTIIYAQPYFQFATFHVIIFSFPLFEYWRDFCMKWYFFGVRLSDHLSCPFMNRSCGSCNVNGMLILLEFLLSCSLMIYSYRRGAAMLFDDSFNEFASMSKLDHFLMVYHLMIL